MDKLIKRWKELVAVPKSILTPSLSGKSRLDNSYLRYMFIAQTIEYLAHKTIFEGEIYIGGQIIAEAIISNSSWRLGNRTCKEIELMLLEMATGLELLEAKDLGTYETTGIKSIDDNGKCIWSKVTRHCGFSYALSEKGWESYRKQEYQILLAQLQTSRINRFTAYAALVISVIAALFTMFSNL